MEQGRTANVAVVFPGQLKITALVIALSEPETKMLERMAEQLQNPDNVEFKARFLNGALEVTLEMDTPDHTEFVREQLPAPNVQLQDVLTAEDAAALAALSGTGGLVNATVEPAQVGQIGPVIEGTANTEPGPDVPDATHPEPASDPAAVADAQDPTGLVDPT